MKKIIIYLIILCFWIGAASVAAQGIGLRFPDTIMVQGDTLILPLIVDSTLTGEEVYSFNLDVRFDDYYFEYLGVSKGELTSGFSDLVVNADNRESVLISGAGGAPLAGTGTLLYVHFRAISYYTWGSTVSLYSSSILNEGMPLIVPQSGRVSIQQAPEIAISPNDADLLVGETQDFYVYGDTVSPFVFEVEDPAVGSIDADGRFTALAPGHTKVMVTDSAGTVDYTNNDINVFAAKLSAPYDMEAWQGSVVDVPVILLNASGSDIISGSFKFDFNDYYLSYLDYTLAGTLLESAYVEVVEMPSEELIVNFATSMPLEDDSVLMYLHFDVSREQRGYTYLSFSDILFNEDIVGMAERGRFQTINYQTVNLYHSSYDLIAGDIVPLNFYGGILPYSYASSDTTVAVISDEGVVTALKGGSVTFSATDSVGSQKVSNVFTVYDTYIEVPDTTGPEGGVFLLPVYIGEMLSGAEASAFQIGFSYRTPELEFLELVTEGSLTQGWALATSNIGNEINISGANTTSLAGSGVLFYLKFGFTTEFTINEQAYVNIEQVMLNEGYPTAYPNDGYIKCVKPEDLLISKLIAPVSDCNLTAEEDVVVEIKNNGYTNYHIGDTLMVSYRVYYNSTVYDTIILEQDFPMKTVMIYTFEQKADLSQDNKEYHIEVQTELSSERDADPNNDRIYTHIINFRNPTLYLGEDISTCVQEPVIITAPEGFVHYEWSTGELDTNAVSVDTTMILWLTVMNDYGCTVTDTIEVVIHPIPEKPQITYSVTEACVGDTVWLEAPAGYMAYEWTSRQLDSIIAVTQSGEYGVMVYNEGMCVSDTSDLIDVVFYNKPLANFSYTNEGLRVSFTNLSLEANTYWWAFGDGKYSSDENPVHQYSLLADNYEKSASVEKLDVAEVKNEFVVSLRSYNGVCDDYYRDTIPYEALASSTLYETICEGAVYEFDNQYLNESGTYIRAYVDSLGNEMVEALYLTVAEVYRDTLMIDICEYEPLYFNGNMLTEAGFYTDTFVSSLGCDSIVTIDLTIMTGTVDSIEAVICDGSYYLFAGDTLWTPGVYITTEPVGDYPFAAPPCIKTVLTLDVEPSGFMNDTITICKDDLPFEYNGHIFPVGTTSGEKILSFESEHGCWSEIILQLTVIGGDSTYVIDYGMICPNEEINGIPRVDENFDTLRYTNKCGFDSIIIHRWEMIPIPDIDIKGAVNVVLNTPVVYSVSLLAEYIEWFIEDTTAVLTYLNDTAIEVVFSEVKVYQLQAAVFNQCGYYADTFSINVDSTAAGLDDRLYDNVVEVYPNPAQDFVQLKSLYQISSVVVYNSHGATVISKDVKGKQVHLDLSAIRSQGIYFIKVICLNKKEYFVKIMLE